MYFLHYYTSYQFILIQKKKIFQPFKVYWYIHFIYIVMKCKTYRHQHVSCKAWNIITELQWISGKFNFLVSLHIKLWYTVWSRESTLSLTVNNSALNTSTTTSIPFKLWILVTNVTRGIKRVKKFWRDCQMSPVSEIKKRCQKVTGVLMTLRLWEVSLSLTLFLQHQKKQFANYELNLCSTVDFFF